MNRTAKIITAFAAGAAAGALLGVLFAPAKGSDTREKIKDKAKKLSTGLEEKLCKAEQKIKDLKTGIENAVKEKTENFS
ncbi:MAG TPA: YtxH domain-containing protein [Ferruginibacter sp.]|nr:YtxH domain-containing protein [Ferruginibacter sp.]